MCRFSAHIWQLPALRGRVRRENPMKKFLIATGACAALAFMLASVPDAAYAQRGIKSGYCPDGTCAKNGGPRARNVANRAASNCRGGNFTPATQRRTR